MRIGIFVLMAGRSAGGPETYEVELIRALAAIDRENEYRIYCTGQYAVDAIAVHQCNFGYQILKPAFRPMSVALTLPVLLLKDGLDFCHATFTPPPLSTCPLMFTLHCLSSIEHPDSYRPLTALRLNALLKTGIRRANLIACVSETTSQHVQQMFGVPRERMLVTYNGVGRQFTAMDPAAARQCVGAGLGIRDPYILYLGKLQAHKNVVGLLEAYHRFSRKTGSRIKLVIAGGKAAGYNGVEEAAARLGLDDRLIRTGYVSLQHLPALYAAARMFVFPSFWEGFGIPIIEAMACGVPVVTSKVTCLPEIAGDAALQVDPCNVDEIADAMVRLESSSSLRQDLTARGFARARLFTWEKCARATLEGYRRMAG